MSREQYVTIGEVAKRCGLPRWKLAYLIERGDLPEASLHVPGRRLFTESDVQKVLKALALRNGS